MQNLQSHSRVIGLLVATLFVGGCTATTTTQVAHDAIELDPMVLLHSGDEVRTLEARPLFKQGTELYGDGKYEEALARFGDVARFFPDSNYAPHARFNAGLALMRLKRYDEALEAFGAARSTLLEDRDRWDARLQQAACLEELKRWESLVPLQEEILAGARLSVTQRIENQARLGVAHYELGNLALAEQALERALDAYRHNTEVPSLERNDYVSQAQFLIGEIYRGLFSTIAFKLPVETMARDLTDKSSFFLKGQSAYLKCIRLNHAHWSVAAGYRLGKLYEDFYDDMMTAEIPGDLDDEDKEIYFSELRKHIRPLVMRSIEVYERNLGMSDRLGAAGTEWAERTQASLDRMRHIMRTEFTEAEPQP